MYIVAGLGNPGREYEYTRHNAGFMVIDEIADRFNIDIRKSKFKGLCGDGIINGEKVILLKPQTYMNASGESLLDAVQFYKIDMQELIVVYDDVSLPLGRMRIRPSGSDGGHNGMKSILYLLGRDDFPRVRVGIGSPRRDMISHVIGEFSDTEQKIVSDVIKVSADAVLGVIKEGAEKAMNKFNSYKHQSLLQNEKVE